MTPAHIALMQRACPAVSPKANTAAVRFYEWLFVLAPLLRSLFHGTRREQGHQRMAMLHMVVAELRPLEELVPIVHPLGVRYPGRVGKWWGNLVLQV